MESLEERTSDVEKNTRVGTFVGHISGAVGMYTANLLPLNGGAYYPESYPELFERISYRNGAYFSLTINGPKLGADDAYEGSYMAAIDPITRWVYVFSYSSSMSSVVCMVYNESLQYVRQAIPIQNFHYLASCAAYNNTVAVMIGNGSSGGQCSVSTDAGVTWHRGSILDGFSFGAISITSINVMFIGTRQYGSNDRRYYSLEFSKTTKSFGAPAMIRNKTNDLSLSLAGISSGTSTGVFVIDGTVYASTYVNDILSTSIVSGIKTFGINSCNLCAYDEKYLLPRDSGSHPLLRITNAGVEVAKYIGTGALTGAPATSGTVIYPNDRYLIINNSLNTGMFAWPTDNSSWVTAVNGGVALTSITQTSSSSFMAYDRSNSRIYVCGSPMFTLPSVSIQGIASYVRAR